MQLTQDQIISLVNPGRELADAFAVAKLAAKDTSDLVCQAMAWLEDQYQSVAKIGTEDIFGGQQTPEKWAADRARYNSAMVELQRVGVILGVL